MQERQMSIIEMLDEQLKKANGLLESKNYLGAYKQYQKVFDTIVESKENSLLLQERLALSRLFIMKCKMRMGTLEYNELMQEMITNKADLEHLLKEISVKSTNKYNIETALEDLKTDIEVFQHSQRKAVARYWYAKFISNHIDEIQDKSILRLLEISADDPLNKVNKLQKALYSVSLSIKAFEFYNDHESLRYANELLIDLFEQYADNCLAYAISPNINAEKELDYLKKAHCYYLESINHLKQMQKPIPLTSDFRFLNALKRLANADEVNAHSYAKAAKEYMEGAQIEQKLSALPDNNEKRECQEFYVDYVGYFNQVLGVETILTIPTLMDAEKTEDDDIDHELVIDEEPEAAMEEREEKKEAAQMFALPPKKRKTSCPVTTEIPHSANSNILFSSSTQATEPERNPVKDSVIEHCQSYFQTRTKLLPYHYGNVLREIARFHRKNHCNDSVELPPQEYDILPTTQFLYEKAITLDMSNARAKEELAFYLNNEHRNQLEKAQQRHPNIPFPYHSLDKTLVRRNIYLDNCKNDGVKKFFWKSLNKYFERLTGIYSRNKNVMLDALLEHLKENIFQQTRNQNHHTQNITQDRITLPALGGRAMN